MPSKKPFPIAKNEPEQNDNPSVAKSTAIDARFRAQFREHNSIDPAWIVDRTGIAQILRVQPRTIEHWVREQKIPVFKLSARCQRFRVEDVIRALQKFEVKEAGYRGSQTK
jgi:hypothetical protein